MAASVLGVAAAPRAGLPLRPKASSKALTVTSAGVVPLRWCKSGRMPLLLLIQQRNGIWCFPKGRVEAGDGTLRATAERELLEETGLRVHTWLAEGPIHTHNFTYTQHPTEACGEATRVRKRVHLFAALVHGVLRPQAEEVAAARWCTPDAARALITHPVLNGPISIGRRLMHEMALVHPVSGQTRYHEGPTRRAAMTAAVAATSQARRAEAGAGAGAVEVEEAKEATETGASPATAEGSTADFDAFVSACLSAARRLESPAPDDAPFAAAACGAGASADSMDMVGEEDEEGVVHVDAANLKWQP